MFYILLKNGLDCSKECQVTDWKKHKVECHKNLSNVTVPKREATEELKMPVVSLAKSTCSKCNKIYLDKELLVCAKCKYIGCRYTLLFCNHFL